MENLYCEEDYINVTENCSYGSSGIYETYTDNPGELFRGMQKEYGRCISKIYIDIENISQHIGWVFEKISYYEDTKEPYKQQVWITLHTNLPDKIVTNHYHVMD